MEEMRLLALGLQLGKHAEWQAEFAAIAACNGYSFRHKSDRIIVWKDELIRRVELIRYTEGWELSSTHTGRSGKSIAIINRRLYFNHESEIDPRKQDLILNGIKRPRTQTKELVHRTVELYHNLIHSIGADSAQEYLLDQPEEELLKSLSMVSGEIKLEAESTEKIEAFYSRAGYDLVKLSTVILVVGCNVSKTFAVKYRQVLLQVARKKHVNLDVVITSTDKLLERLKNPRDINLSGKAIMLILNDKNGMVCSEDLVTMSLLDSRQIQWRRSYDNDVISYSIENQFESMIQASGGIPHRVEVYDRSLPWSLGIDVSHPLYAQHSVVGVSLIGPFGQLVQSWTLRQLRNERISRTTLNEMLPLVAKYINNNIGDSVDLLMLRDGRLFEEEMANDYIKHFKGCVTLVEVRKRRNPLMVSSRTLQLPLYPTYGIVGNTRRHENVVYMNSCPKVLEGGLPTTLKLTWRDEWDGMRLGSNMIAKYVYALCLSPGLSASKRILPAPLYWADGIAEASDQNLKFRGQNVICL